MSDKTIFGLDISTTTIGLAVLINGKKPKLKHVEYFKPPKNGNLFERLSIVKTWIKSKLDEFKPDVIVIEDIISFMKGHSGSKTIISLAVINRTVGLTIFEHTGIVPYIVNVNTIRALTKINERLKKEDIPDMIEKTLKIKFPYVINAKGKIAEESYDMADAVAAALSFTNPKFKFVEI